MINVCPFSYHVLEGNLATVLYKKKNYRCFLQGSGYDERPELELDKILLWIRPT